jgi:hypothetical protein
MEEFLNPSRPRQGNEVLQRDSETQNANFISHTLQHSTDPALREGVKILSFSGSKKTAAFTGASFSPPRKV